MPWKALLAVTAASISQIGADAALPCRFGGLDHESRCARSDDHPVPAAVERQGGVLDHVVGRGRAAGQEAGAGPGQQRVRGDVVSGDDDHPPAAAGILIQSSATHSACAVLAHAAFSCVFGPARADQLGELRVAHRQRPEQEAAVEDERLSLQRVAQIGDAPVDLARPPGPSALIRRAHVLEHLEFVSARRGPRGSG